MLDPREKLRALARGARGAGTPADAAARAHVHAVLGSLGFAVRGHRFTYSQLPGRWATPVIGTLATVMASRAAWLGYHGEGARAFGALIGAALALLPVGWWLGTRGVLSHPGMRAEDVNLIAMRGDGRPNVWLMAHTDSKSQPVPTAVRASGILVLALAVLGIALCGAAAAFGWFAAPPQLWAALGGAVVVGGVPVALTTVGNRSHGAFDNASGVATVLAAAAALPAGARVGVVITAAEELGLAGARAWVRDEARPGDAVLNVDGVDDTGPLTVMYTGRRAERVIAALRAASQEQGEAFRALPMLPGILTDSVAVAAKGYESATLSRGTLASLGRVHTPDDTLDNLDGTGIAGAARVLALAAVLLAEKPAGGKGA